MARYTRVWLRTMCTPKHPPTKSCSSRSVEMGFHLKAEIFLGPEPRERSGPFFGRPVTASEEGFLEQNGGGDRPRRREPPQGRA